MKYSIFIFFQAKVQFKVIDETGGPVEGAMVANNGGAPVATNAAGLIPLNNDAFPCGTKFDYVVDGPATKQYKQATGIFVVPKTHDPEVTAEIPLEPVPNVRISSQFKIRLKDFMKTFSFSLFMLMLLVQKLVPLATGKYTFMKRMLLLILLVVNWLVMVLMQLPQKHVTFSLSRMTNAGWEILQGQVLPFFLMLLLWSNQLTSN